MPDELEASAMWVKICGTTNAEDARVAIAAGADAVGFVFAPSRRRVTAAKVAAMGLGAEPVERVGVFTTGDGGEIAAMVAEAGLTGVQLHCGEGGLERLAEEVGRRLPGVVVVPVVHWVVEDPAAGTEVARTLEALRGAGMRRVLLDAKVGVALGGTGVSFAWERAAEVLAGVRAEMEIVVAGGLRPETVGEAVRVLQPWGVDVVSGVEREPARKDEAAVRAFVRAARER